MNLIMPTLLLRSVKGSPLTSAEIDANMTTIKTFTDSLAEILANVVDVESSSIAIASLNWIGQSLTATVGAPDVTLDWSKGMTHSVTLLASTATEVSFTNPTDGQSIVVRVDGATGATVTWAVPDGFTLLWKGGNAPAASTTEDLFSFTLFGTTIYGAAAADFK